MSARRDRGGGGRAAGAEPPSVVNALEQQTLGVGMEIDLDGLAVKAELRREILNAALDASSLKKGADFTVERGRVLVTREAALALLGMLGQWVAPETLEAAKNGRLGPLWNLPAWRRMRVTNPRAGNRLILGYLMDNGEGCSCLVPDTGVFLIGMHVVVQKTALASAPELFELAEVAPRSMGRW